MLGLSDFYVVFFNAHEFYFNLCNLKLFENTVLLKRRERCLIIAISVLSNHTIIKLITDFTIYQVDW